MLSTIKKVVFFAGALAYAQQPAWAQCGGIGWSGGTTCVSGYTCTRSNEYYSQCLPGTAGTTLTTSVTSTRTGTATTTPPVSTTGSGSGGYPGATLVSPYIWIRAVEAPNFHAYLQTSPTNAPGTAILSSYTTAGQFNIVNGQLVELVSATGGLLYANVEERADATVNKLAVTFTTTPNTYGTFSWSGDALQWSIASISRPNLSAWLVCTNQQLFINLGAYAYMTPAGCADETIHFYNGATAVD
ncbi:carbohydrate-binding module family 1 protein [Phlyctema vagabunda]|uniref:Carbohydrate-binding module family 1 protein n=1 Tax=Phlyctema vagabunda TaxID=108571 RepID=A0ABR4PVU7_9HELO